MSTKRVSLDEKRTRMLQIFYEKKEFFTLKELEKIAPKEKGIVQQSVKDVLQALVDDGFVRSEKIGSTIYFWTFPGENITKIEERIADSNKIIVEAEFKLQKLDNEIKKLQAEKGDTAEKQAVLAEIQQWKEKEIDVKQKIEKLSDADPEVIAKISDQATKYLEAANVWTDNISAIQSWCRNKFNISEETLHKQFGLPETVEYLEYTQL